MAIDRALFRAWVGPFAASLSAFVGLLLLGHVRKIAAAALGAGLNPSDLLQIVVALLPNFLVFALPLAHLTAVVYSLGRWTDSGELVGWAAAGASPFRLARVPLFCGGMVMGVGLPVAHWAQPAGWSHLQSVLTDLAVRNVTGALAGAPLAHTMQDFTIAATERRGPVLHSVLISRAEAAPSRDNGSSPNGGTSPPTPLLVAQRARILTAPARLKDGSDARSTASEKTRCAPAMSDAAHRSDPAAERCLRSQVLVIQLEDGEAHPAHLPDDDSYVRGRFRVAQISIDLADELRRRTRLVSEHGRLSTPALRAAAARNDADGSRYRKMAARRTALPALALVFGWLGVSIATRSSRQRWPFAAGAVLVFYVLMRLGDAVAASVGQSTGWAGVEAIVWVPHALLGVIGWFWLRALGRPR